MKRGEPQINRDHYGVCYVIVDDDGEPVTDFIFDDGESEAIDLARRQRVTTPEWKNHRIVECGYRCFAEEPEVVDDPRRKVALR